MKGKKQAKPVPSSKAMARQGKNAVRGNDAGRFAVKNGLTAMLEKLKPHDHLCLIYETQEEWRAAVVPFIAIGLKKREKCVYVVDTSTADEIRRYLGEEGIDVAKAEKTGQLAIFNEAEAYSRGGFFDPDKMIALLIAETEKAVAEGYAALRVSGEMTWVLRNYPGSEKLLEYEAKLNRDFFPRYPCLAICQYDRWKFDAEVIKGVIMTHPLLVKGNDIYRNFYYIPTEEYLNTERSRIEAQRWLNNLAREKEAHEALLRSEDIFTKAFRISPNLMSITTEKEGSIIDVNERFCDALGFTREEAIGRTTMELNIWHKPEQRDMAIKILQEKGYVENLEVELQTKSGEVRAIIISMSRLLINNEACMVTIAADITERKNAEEAYIASEQNFRNSMDASPLGIRIVTGGGELIYANQAILDIWGYGSIEELKAVPRKQLYTPESYAAHEERLEKRKRGEAVPPEYEISIRRPDGAVRHLQVFREEVTWGGERQYMAMYQDITERRKAEEALERESREIRLIIDAAPVLVFYKDREGKFLRVNKAFAEALNMPEKDFLGKTVFDLYSAGIAQGMTNDDLEVFKSGRSKLNIIEQYESATGLRWVQTDKVPIFDDKGITAGLIGFAQDITEHKQAEEALRREKSLAQRYLDIAGVIIVANNAQGDISLMNRMGCEILGYREEEIIGKNWLDNFIPERDREQVKSVFRRIIAGEIEPLEYYENPVLARSGEERTIAWHNAVIRDDAGTITGTLSSGEDITERKQAEEALRRSEENYRRMVELIPDGILTIDKTGIITSMNRAVTEITGFAEEDIIGKHIAKVPVLNFKNVPQALKIFSDIIGGNAPERIEITCRKKDGTQRIGEFRVSLIKTEGKTTGIQVIARDITERKEAEERINHLNLTLRSVRNVNQLITREKDRDRLIQGICDTLVESRSFNSAWIVLLDESKNPVAWAEANVTGDFPAFIESIKRWEYPRCMQRVLKQKRTVITENPTTMCAGCPMLGDITEVGSVTARLEIKGTVYGIICASMPQRLMTFEEEISLFNEVAADIAFALHNIELSAEYQLLMQERLRLAKLESIGTLAGGIAHDFNNLLAGIMGNIGLIKTHMAPSDTTFDMLDEAEKAAVRARDLTQQLLTFAKGGKPVKRLIEIAGLIKESAVFALRGSNVRLGLSLPDDLWSVEADEGQISQVINNLVMNADEAMPSGGTLKIEAGNCTLKKVSALPLVSGNYVRIDIQDTGTGISQEHLQRIFEPYFTTKHKGSGLGLTSAYSIVRNHGGYILAESRQNEGSTFHIYLPASKKAVKGEKQMAAAKSGQAGGKVLVMDDEEIIRKMLKNMLSLAGYEVVLAADGAEALGNYRQALAEGKPFFAVIMDLTIPGGMGGKEAVKRLLEIDPQATAIVSSGYATDPIMSEYKKYGFKAVIAKPYSIRQLRETLSGLSRRKKK